MNNIYTVVPCRKYKATATEACTLTDGHGLTLQLEPGTPATFEAKTSELHATLPVVLQSVLGVDAADGGALKQPETREECDWVLIWKKCSMGTSASLSFNSDVIEWDTLTSLINAPGGICLLLGEYAVLCKRPAGWTWDSQDILMFFSVFEDLAALDVEIRYYYFNIPGIDA